MSYAIGIGVCTSIEGAEVCVGLDSAIVSKLIPGRPWDMSGSSSLRFDSRLCSAKRLLQIGSEVYLDASALDGKSPAVLSLAGASKAIRVDLHALLEGPGPSPAPSPAAKGRSSRW